MSRRRTSQRLPGFRQHDPQAGVWWQRSADPIGLHTLGAFALGLVLVAVVSVAFDPLGVTTRYDLPEVQLEAEAAAYAPAYQAAYEASYAGFVNDVLVSMARYAGESESDWLRGVREGRIAGWNEALDALLAASAAQAPADERPRERDVLAAIERR